LVGLNHFTFPCRLIFIFLLFVMLLLLLIIK